MHPVLVDGVDLVDDHDRRRQIEMTGDPLIAGAERLGRIDHEADRIDVADAVERRCVDPLAERRDRFVQTGRVDEDHLRVGGRQDAAHASARRLRLVADDRHLAPAHRVDERRLADVRSPDECDESAAHDYTHRRRRRSAEDRSSSCVVVVVVATGGLSSSS